MSKQKVILERLDNEDAEELDLEEAVRAATSGDTIILNSGVYELKETLVVDHTSFTLKGQGADRSVITSSAGGCVLRLMGAFSWRMEKIGFHHTGKRWANVVEVDGDIIDHQHNARVRIHECRFSGAKRQKGVRHSGAGLLIWGYTEGEVKNCEAFDNDLAGIKLYNHASPTVSANICRGNGVAGIVYDEYATGLVVDNKFRENNCGIVVLSEAKPQLAGNKFWRNKHQLADWRNGDFDGIDE
jgi:parallel beta-helix repeat protein